MNDLHQTSQKTIKYPKVMLVGRTNVGKSTLFNRLTQQKKSIVFEREGVTRDYLQELISWDDKSFLLIDTGGFSFAKNQDDISKRVQEKVLDLLGKADLLLFVCDGKNGLTDDDRKIAQLLRKTNKPVFLLLNKADNQAAINENLPEFYSLGFKNILSVSGMHGIGIGALLGLVSQTIKLPEETDQEQPSYKVAIIGRPNVGKSSLMNLLMHHERSIVSNVAGTTREPISDTTYFCNELIQVTDTAGVRRSKKIDDDLESLMVKSTLQAVKEADIIVMMIDASEGKIADQELKLLFYAYEQHKMIIAVFNKTDLVDDYARVTLEQSLLEYQFVLKKMPQLWISCATKKNVAKIFNEIQKIWKRCSKVFNQIEVDELVKQELTKKHLFHNGQELKVIKVIPLKSTIPSFLLIVNHPQWFGTSEINCVENILRKSYDLEGCPVKITVKER